MNHRTIESIDRRAFILGALLAPGIGAQQSSDPPPAAESGGAPVEFVCPMDKEVRSPQPGRCPRCGMALVAGLPDGAEYRVALRLRPSAPRAGQPLQLSFTVSDPKTGRTVTDFQVVHEKLYHLFIVSQDLQYFLHGHPQKESGGAFRFSATLPKPGMYRLLSDFYPRAGTPQLIASTLVVPGGTLTPGTELKPDLSPQKAGGIEVSLTTEPRQPIAGMKTLMFFHLEPGDGLEQYLGAWGHMLAASGDLVDMIHTHPFLADGGPQIQFNLIFPRPGVYRVWTQFQRKGEVITTAFNVPVSELK